MAPKSFRLATATKAKIQERVTAESSSKNDYVSPELKNPMETLVKEADQPCTQSCSDKKTSLESLDRPLSKSIAIKSGASVSELLERFDAIHAA